MSSSVERILVCGDVRGKYKQLFERINTVHKKSGPFHMVLCVGEFFTDDDHQYNELINGTICLPPISIYILGTSDERLVKYYKSIDPNADYDSGFELRDGIIYLGRKGILTGSSGLRIAYLSGHETNNNISDNNKTLFTMKDYESLLLSQQSSSAIVDILVTSQWPKHVFRHSEGHPPQLDDISQKQGSELVSKLSLLLRPRYHFVASFDSFYERHPFRNHRVLAEAAKPVTRFVSVAEVSNKTKAKWLYAFAITAAKDLDVNELIKQPNDVTENPFNDISFDPKTNPKNENVSQFFYDLNENNNKSDNNYNQHNKRKRQNQNEFRQRKQRNVDPQDCWFCLASPQVEKHLIISIGEHNYLAMAKGGLTDEHLLILPIEHMRSTIEIESEEVLTEINRFKSSLIRYFDTKQESVVFFERNFKSSHLQIQCVSIPKSKTQNLKSIILEETDKKNLEFIELESEIELKDVINTGIPYFYIELPDCKLFTRIKTNQFFPLQLGRELLCHPSILNCLDRIDWKQCALSEDQVITLANKIRKNYEPFDFTLLD